MTDIFYNGFLRISTVKNKPNKLLLTMYDKDSRIGISIKREIDQWKLNEILALAYADTAKWCMEGKVSK